MIQSSGTECRRYLPRHYLIPKYVLLLTSFNSAAEGVVSLPTDSLSPVRHGVVDARDLQFRELYKALVLNAVGYLPRRCITPKCVLLLTFLNSAAEGVISMPTEPVACSPWSH